MQEKQRDTFLNNRGKRILFVVFGFLLLYVVSYLIDPYADFWKNYFDREIGQMLLEWTTSLAFCFVIAESSIALSNKLNTSLPWTEYPILRLAVETGVILLIVLLVNFIIGITCFYLENDGQLSVIEVQLSVEETRGLFQWFLVSILIAFMMIGINTGNYLILNWKNAALKATQLNQLAMESELQSLKLQIDPHFVFNNLSVLSELILEDQQLGYEYAENFSKIYRYMLINSRKDMILLEDELKFLNSYMFLIKHRIGEGVHFQIEVSARGKQLYLPPLTLQLLVENALKHNKTLKKNPLSINIYDTENNELIVENMCFPIENPMESSGIGINNIIRRYSLLSAKSPEILKTSNTFQVLIPLIKL